MEDSEEHCWVRKKVILKSSTLTQIPWHLWLKPWVMYHNVESLFLVPFLSFSGSNETEDTIGIKAFPHRLLNSPGSSSKLHYNSQWGYVQKNLSQLAHKSWSDFLTRLARWWLPEMNSIRLIWLFNGAGHQSLLQIHYYRFHRMIQLFTRWIVTE